MIARHRRGQARDARACPGDAGVEARLNARVSLFGVLSASHDVHGGDYRERAANVGVRVRW
jgi:fibronectin-binding autotransporter adhesin